MKPTVVMLRDISKRFDRAFSCEGKVKYGHKETADKACAAMLEKYGTILESYDCRHCDGWHIGHPQDL